MRYLTWRSWLLRAQRLWRSSLQVRTVTISVVMSTIAVGIIGAYMSISVGANLFDTRLVNVHVQRLRAKVELDPDNPRIVMTVRGVGYRAGSPA